MKKIAISQSNYVPWRGYFDLISQADEFIIYDDMQFTKNDWRNRNQIKTPQGVIWLSIPAGDSINRKIREVQITNSTWQFKHLKTLEFNYKRAPYYQEIMGLIAPLYLDIKYETLSEANESFIRAICNYLDIATKITHSWDYGLSEGKTERLIDLCNQACASKYISGPSAKNYLNKNLFTDSNIELVWMNYGCYQPYPQLWGSFDGNLSILDALFNCGKSTMQYLTKI